MGIDEKAKTTKSHLHMGDSISTASGASLAADNTQTQDSPTTVTDEKSILEKTNILQVSKYYFPVTGGMQTVVRNLITGIDDPHFRVLTSRPAGTSRRDEVDETEIIRVGSIGEFESTPLSPSFPYHLRRQLAWADLVHYHLPFPVGPVSHLLNRAMEKPTVVTFHDEIIDKDPYIRPYKPILDKFLRAAEQIIVTSPNMRDECSQISDFAGKTTIVPLGIETDGMQITPHAVSNKHIVFVGRLVHFKGVRYLISAMKELDASLSIVGDGPRREILEQHASKEGVSHKTTFEGFVSEEKLDRLYRTADIFVLPSIGENESFGIVQLEAMKRGLPVINTALSTGVPYVSVDGMTGITVQPGRPDEIAAAASALFENPELYRRYSTNAQQRVHSKFSRKQMLSKTEDIYRDVVTTE